MTSFIFYRRALVNSLFAETGLNFA